jgi:hypothetical protein
MAVNAEFSCSTLGGFTGSPLPRKLAGLVCCAKLNGVRSNPDARIKPPKKAPTTIPANLILDKEDVVMASLDGSG